MTELIEFWGPEDSSITFCEKNYDNSKYIAEYYNTLTAFTTCMVGIYFLNSRLRKESAYAMIALGFTTAIFHGTMRYWGQWCDELSMLYLSFMLIKEVHNNLSYMFLGWMVVTYLMYWDTFIVFFIMFMGMQTYLYLLSMNIRHIKDNNRLFLAKEAKENVKEFGNNMGQKIENNVKELYIGIGSNLDNPILQVSNAIEALTKLDKFNETSKFLSLTNGDAGHQSEGGGALGNRRRAESKNAGNALGIAEYQASTFCLLASCSTSSPLLEPPWATA